MALITGLRAGYKLDGNSNDCVGTSNGTDVTITYSTANGKINQGAGFNGTTSKIPLGSNTLTITNGSVNMWVYFNAYTTTLSRPLTGLLGYFYFELESTNKITLQYYDTVGHTITHPINILLNTWYMLTATWNGSIMSFYVNGTLTGTTAFSSLGNAEMLELGHVTAYYFNGNVDEVFIWNRPITSTEVTQLYNGGSGLAYPFNTNSNLMFFKRLR